MFIGAIKKKSKLSAYTIAKNCTDISDVNAGIDELKVYFKNCDMLGKKPSKTALSRFAKLMQKKEKMV